MTMWRRQEEAGGVGDEPKMSCKILYKAIKMNHKLFNINLPSPSDGQRDVHSILAGYGDAYEASGETQRRCGEVGRWD